MYRGASFLVLDEATSALDNVTESQVISNIKNTSLDITIVMVAHRLSTLTICDQILVLENGVVSGAGSWEELELGNKTFQELITARQDGEETQ